MNDACNTFISYLLHLTELYSADRFQREVLLQFGIENNFRYLSREAPQLHLQCSRNRTSSKRRKQYL